ncbi:MAG: deoxyribodipyrimidine photo-lyase [Anaerolineales bacterium]
MISAIWWIRRDLRLMDNQALRAALEQAEMVFPVFILDPKVLNSPYAAPKRITFIFDGLRALDRELRMRGSLLVVRQGHPLEALHTLKNETGATSIFAEADISPYARQRDKKVMDELPLTLTPGVTVHPPDILYKPDGLPYTVYTPFQRMWQSLTFPNKLIPAPEQLPVPPLLSNLGVPGTPGQSAESLFPAGEVEGRRRLDAFIDTKINSYAEDRNRLDLDGTSRLSPYLRFGMLSARQAAWAARQADERARDASSRQGVETWLNELIWREFYAAILYHFPNVRRTAFRSEMRGIRWREDIHGFEAWAEGYTGYPVVDAAMRQMNATGWMHNRARMITASFLVKDLLIDWQQGEQYFIKHLLDGDPAANNGGWQWTAGTGTDAAPYFRVFNPVLQGKKFDPQGAYVRRWVPELDSVPNAFIHAPWEMPAGLQEKLGCVIGKDYPAPIVDHVLARQRVLEAYRKVKR